MGVQTYYELLGVPEDCSIEDIKKAYKKMALRHHPDKNLNATEEAKVLFSKIKDAYDVLVNPVERSWYDRHQEAFHNDEEHHNDIDKQLDEIIESAVYVKIDDSKEGFFTVIRRAFEAIINQEDVEELAKVMHGHIPEFGDSKSEPLDAKRFYDAWSAFQSTIMFNSLNKYDIREADNRRVLRLMEKENAKIRDKARKERNKKIRDFVSFVRVKDPRMAEYKKILEKRILENRQKSERKRREMIAQRNSEVKDYVEQEWSSMSALEGELKKMEAQLDDDSDEVDNGRDRRRKKKDKKRKNRRRAQTSSEEEEDSQEEENSDSDSERNNQNGLANDTEREVETSKSSPNPDPVANSINNGVSNVNGSVGVQPEVDSDDHADGFYCGPCHKTFRTAAAFNNHIRSRKHVQRVALEKSLPQDGGDDS